MASSHRLPRRTVGFTLVELLVVIGIIAILVSILLPSLAQARRQANSIKCLASLKENGNAFKMYAIDYKGVWPMAAWRPANAPNAQWSAWTDAINRYVKKNGDTQARGDIGKNRQNSVLWGCPEYRLASEYNAGGGSGSSDFNYTGYGMSYLPGKYWDTGDSKYQSIWTDNVPSTGTGVAGSWTKYTDWNRVGADRLLVADAVVEFIKTPGTFSRATIEIPPYDAMSPWTAPQFYVDSARHAKPGTAKKNIFKARGVNILYCDGHAGSGSVQDAWNAIHNPGQDRTGP